MITTRKSCVLPQRASNALNRTARVCSLFQIIKKVKKLPRRNRSVCVSIARVGLFKRQNVYLH